MKLIHKYFPELTTKQIRQFEQLYDLYSDWNQKINLISRKEIPFLYERHIIHSLSVAKFIQFAPGTAVADVGTGGGFPGIPLAIVFPDARFVLIDSIAKKIQAVNEIVRCAEINNVQTIISRAEKLNLKFDFVVSRAVTGLVEFCIMTKNLISKKSFNTIENGIIYIKGGDFEKELNEFPGKKEVVYISNYFSEDFFLTKKIVYISGL